MLVVLLTTTMDDKTSKSQKVTTTKTISTTYRTTAGAAPRTLVITRTSGGKLSSAGGATGSSSMTRTTTMTRGDAADAGFAEGAYSNFTATGVNQVKTTRDQEKKDMQDLNDRFSDYISKVSISCCNNKKLSCRRETALEGALVLAKSGTTGLGDDILRTSSTTVT